MFCLIAAPLSCVATVAKRNPLKAKVFQANMRENKALYGRPLRDDGFLRRHDKDPLTAQETRDKSRDREFWLPASVARAQERSYRGYILREKGPEDMAWRQELVGSKSGRRRGFKRR